MSDDSLDHGRIRDRHYLSKSILTFRLRVEVVGQLGGFQGGHEGDGDRVRQEGE